jgi:hypothetical protein
MKLFYIRRHFGEELQKSALEWLRDNVVGFVVYRCDNGDISIHNLKDEELIILKLKFGL